MSTSQRQKVSDLEAVKSLMGVQHDKSDPIAWNKGWENHLDVVYRLLPTLRALVPQNSDRDSPSAWDERPVDPLDLEYLEGFCKSLVSIQTRLSDGVAYFRDYHQFDSQWLLSSAQHREQVMLQGLLKTSSVTPDMEERRTYCPEITMANLQRDGGKGFLDLLTTICPIGRRAPLPVLIKSQQFETQWKIGAPVAESCRVQRQLLHQTLVLARNVFLTVFLLQTVWKFHGIEQKSSISRHGIADSVRSLAGQGRAAEAIRHEMVEAHKVANYSCADCRTERPNVRDFLLCSKCKAIGRKVHYCNRQCQTHDWKLGNPPHKSICGKTAPMPPSIITTTPQADSMSHQSTESNERTFPDPNPNFSRSLALCLQLQFLQKLPKFDYMIIRVAEGKNQPLILQTPWVKLLFRDLLNRAVVDGDPGTVVKMASLLKFSVSASAAGNELASQLTKLILAQLSREFRLPLSLLEDSITKAEPTSPNYLLQ